VSTAAIVAFALAGCGGSSQTTVSRTQQTTGSTTRPTPAALERAARSAVERNHTLSDYVLAHNSLPSWASQSTSGPALAALRNSAAQRVSGTVRVRVLTSTAEIRSVQLDPSYLTATASVLERSRVRVYQHGHPVGGVRTLNEPARIELHRVGEKAAFVVWKLAPV
jgi:hypothetical protein